jgi:hypothetical protein
MQAPFTQQPVAQLWASQTQAPPRHRVPAAHGPAALPQRQVPVRESQRLALVASQVVQAAPATPHDARLGDWQAPLAQQPDGQESALHVHSPETHAVPAPHAGPAPQAHAPVSAQLSARDGSQLRQAAPPEPQVVDVRGEQVEPEQQPLGQLAGLQPLQTPPVQVVPAQSWQAAPPLPQLAFMPPERQVAPAQQPLAHETRSQTQAPPTQRWPVTQGLSTPHLHTPVDRHRSAVSPQARQAPPLDPQLFSDGARQSVPAQHPLGHDDASHTQLPIAQRCPTAQAAPAAPQTQAPDAEHWSAVTGSQVAHEEPPAPQRAADGATQVVPLQQPFGHEVASHTQAPA